MLEEEDREQKRPTTTTIALNMIVKNEAHIIERCLQSVLGFVDSYYIVDTGSTDGTGDKIEAFFAEHCIPGKLQRGYDMGSIAEFTFDKSRNAALQLSAGKSDLILFMDADMELRINISPDQILAFKKSLMTNGPSYFHIMQKQGALLYSNVRLCANVAEDIAVAAKCTYYGFTHEYFSAASNYTKISLSQETIFMIDHNDGGSKSNKYLRDIQLCKLGIERDHAFLRGRYQFYLANTYYYYGTSISANAESVNDRFLRRDLLEKAITTYKDKISTGGWEQEIWYSHYNMGNCYRELGNMDTAVATWTAAYDYYPHRVENLYEIVKHYTHIGKRRAADIFWRLARGIIDLSPVLNTPSLRAELLFVDQAVYDYALDFQHTIYSNYLDKMKKLDPELLRRIFNKSNQSTYSILLSNYRFYNTALSSSDGELLWRRDLSELAKLEYTDADTGDHFLPSSTSMVECFSGETTKKYVVNVRLVNYKINQQTGSYTYAANNKIVTRNVFMELDAAFNPIGSAKDVITEKDIADLTNIERSRYVGVEDMRVFNMGDADSEKDALFYIGTTYNSWTDKMSMAFGEYNLQTIRSGGSARLDCLLMTIDPDTFLETDIMSQQCEKNWVLINQCGNMRTVYRWGPTMIVCDINIDDDRAITIEPVIKHTMPGIFREVRGSTCGVAYSNRGGQKELWFVCHLVSTRNSPRNYYHMIVVCNEEDMTLLRYSIPFTFEQAAVEYCLSLVVQDDKVVMNYSVWDGRSMMVAYTKLYIDGLLFEHR